MSHPSHILDRFRRTIPILVISNKGGVGKSTVSASIARLLQKHGKVGFVDLDVDGADAKQVLGIDGMLQPKFHLKREPKTDPIVLENIEFFSMEANPLFGNKKQPIVWRGEKHRELITRILTYDVAWSKDLKFWLFDAPPGVGDAIITIKEIFNRNMFVILVSTPDKVSRDDLQRVIHMADIYKFTILGAIENKLGHTCPRCGYVDFIYGEPSIENMCSDLGMTFIGSIPISTEINRRMNSGRPIRHETIQNAVNIILNETTISKGVSRWVSKRLG